MEGFETEAKGNSEMGHSVTSTKYVYNQLFGVTRDLKIIVVSGSSTIMFGQSLSLNQVTK